MCGIVGYVGTRKVVPVLLAGLRRLEYRGYDSAGIVYHHGQELVRHRAEGKLSQLEAVLDEHIGVDSTAGLGHTRWATHGAPTEQNAHPHSDCSGELVVVHNGIIENYSSLKQELVARGHVFQSETDTEVLAHLIEEHLQEDLVLAVRAALAQVEGSYALAVLWAKEPEMLVAARHQSPLVIGVDAEASYLASDIPALLPYTSEVIFLDDGDLAVLQKGAYRVLRLTDGKAIEKKITSIDWTASMAEKGGYRHYMLKEIFEQPLAIRNTISGRIIPDTGTVQLPGLGISDQVLKDLRRIVLVACGTSWHAALVAKYWLEKLVGIPVEVDIGSEFRYRRLLLDEQVLTVVISQSGETADTLEGMRQAARLGSPVLTICNVVGSTMTREADGVLYTHAGPEIGVASTKAFTCQMTALFLFTLYLGQLWGTIGQKEQKDLGLHLINLVDTLSDILEPLRKTVQKVIETYHEARDFLFIGRGINFPIALEGALKLKEISYIHAEGYAGGELKHGPIALIDQYMPVLAIAPQDSTYQKLVTNIEEIKARQGRLILIGTEGDTHLPTLSKDLILLPRVHEDLTPILCTLPAQLLAYEIAALRGCDVDQPRNLAKSVTVE
ncbi:MAG: glutamine--fructose-6-phosphate transaminase (isomerizing) [Desulfobulbaceae bacterium]|nr:glutamine--fructose-6-phosphate transaminase (isomerizing) [Desulfobulbaceae bacterium]